MKTKTKQTEGNGATPDVKIARTDQDVGAPWREEVAPLIPRIKNAIEKGEKVAEHYWVIAGADLLKAKSIVPHGQWTSWVEENFVGWGIHTARRWMQIAEVQQAQLLKSKTRVTSDLSQSEVIRQHINKNYNKRPAWTRILDDGMDQEFTKKGSKALLDHQRTKAIEDKLVIGWAEKIVSIGFKILADKFHPDKNKKEGSADAMRRLNSARAKLREAIADMK